MLLDIDLSSSIVAESLSNCVALDMRGSEGRTRGPYCSYFAASESALALVVGMVYAEAIARSV